MVVVELLFDVLEHDLDRVLDWVVVVCFRR